MERPEPTRAETYLSRSPQLPYPEGLGFGDIGRELKEFTTDAACRKKPSYLVPFICPLNIDNHSEAVGPARS